MYQDYKSLIEKKQTEKVKKAIENARDWWHSLDASQKEAGFATWKYKLTPAVFIKVPVPFCGLVDVIYIGLAGKNSERVSPTSSQLSWLRSIVRNPAVGDWIVEKKPDCVLLLCKPQLKNRAENCSLSEVSCGFITVA